MTDWIQRRSKPSNADVCADSVYHRDRARVIHSAAFRRLQSKTQVYSIGENDFYRTRLTHSLEVAQIGSGICEHLREQYADKPDYLAWIPGNSLIEALGLCHDIGHPPFGHGGEVALNYAMREHGGFEGNGQTLRIVTRLGEYSPGFGMDLSRRTLLGLLKYPNTYSTLQNYPDSSSCNLDDWHPPKCFLDEEQAVFDWIIAPFYAADQAAFTSFHAKPGNHHKTRYKAFDTAIMELADDISYAVHDLEDAITLGLIKRDHWQQEVVEKLQQLADNPVVKKMEFYSNNLFASDICASKHAISKLVGYFIEQIRITPQQCFAHPLLDLQVTLPEDCQQVLTALKKLVFTHAIKRPEVQALEFKGQNMVLRLFNTLAENPQRLLPSNTLDEYENSDNPPRILCDYLAGMTDHHASKVYQRLFIPNTGSIFETL